MYRNPVAKPIGMTRQSARVQGNSALGYRTTSMENALHSLKRISRCITRNVVEVGVACGIALVLPALAHSADVTGASIPTVGGVLRTAPSSGGQQITLNNKPVTRTEGGRSAPMQDDLVALKQIHRVAGNDVVLVQTNCGGSACGGASTLWLITITPAGKATVSDGMDADEEGTAEVKMVGDQLAVTTETVDGRRKKTNRWTYANGKIAKSK